ncbi:MAG TPA: hypothetical protein DCZ03_10880, partial [Gammaproteobacteria bacterium]|nr:hypothetical protein [Gammaproteobacteria bacterium]
HLNLVDLINDCVDYARPLAKEKSLKLKTTFSGKAIVLNANESALWALIRNLLDNAIKYSTDGGEVQILCHAYSQEIHLCVLDTGLGIPELEKERVLERFHRGLGHKEQGSGLGLSIVQRVVEMHGGRLKLANRRDGQPGLRVEVVFPTQLKDTDTDEILPHSSTSEMNNSPLAPSH